MNIKQLNENDLLLEKFFKDTHFLIACLDTEFNFIKVNKAYAQSANRQEKYFVGKNHFDLFPNKENMNIFKRVVKTGKAHSYSAKPFVYRDQPERGVTYWDWTLYPIKDGKRVKAVLLALIDVTEKVQLLERLNQNYEYIGKMNRRVQILGNVKKNNLKTRKDFFTHTCESAISLFNAKFVGIYEMEQEKLRMIWSHDIEKRRGNYGSPKCSSIYKDIDINNYKVLRPLIAEHKKIIGKFPSSKLAEITTNKKLRYFVFLPLTRGKRIFGVLFVGFDKKNDPRKIAHDFMDAFSRQISSVLNNLGLLKNKKS